MGDHGARLVGGRFGGGVMCDVDCDNKAARSLCEQAGFEVGGDCERLQFGMRSAA